MADTKSNKTGGKSAAAEGTSVIYENKAKSVKTTTREWMDELDTRRAKIELGGGAAVQEKRKAGGQMNARERLDALLDVGSFNEMYKHAQHRCTMFGMEGKELAADGVVTGVGMIHGRQISIASQDFTVVGGSVGELHGYKIVEMMKMSLKCGVPFIFINDSGGARIQEAVDSLHAYGQIFHHNVLCSGVVPQISVICGPCAGGAAYSPALTDFIIMVRGQQMFITGPQVVKSVTGEDISAEDLGGVDTQASVTGNIHFVAESEDHAFEITRKLLSYLPLNNAEDPPVVGFYPELPLPDQPELDSVIPDNPRAAYDVRTVVRTVADSGEFFEIQELWAPNIVTGFARFNGQVAGIVANQPMVMAGVLDINGSDKASRFIRFCNAFNIPLVNFVDVPGYLPGVAQEKGGIIRHGAKLLFTYSAATVPKVTIILRKAYGGAYVAMCSKSLAADYCCAWPSAEIAVMGADGAVNIIFRKELKDADDPKAKRQELLDDYREQFANPYQAASRGLIDDVIQPRETRRYIVRALNSLVNKRDLRPPKKHGLMPL